MPITSASAAGARLAALIDREKQLIAHIPDSLTRRWKKRGVHLVRAHGQNSSTPNAVKAGRHIYEAEEHRHRHRLGPRPLAFPGAELMITSDDVLSEREQPRDVSSSAAASSPSSSATFMRAPAPR